MYTWYQQNRHNPMKKPSVILFLFLMTAQIFGQAPKEIFTSAEVTWFGLIFPKQNSLAVLPLMVRQGKRMASRSKIIISKAGMTWY
jgi:hypothetical protein